MLRLQGTLVAFALYLALDSTVAAWQPSTFVSLASFPAVSEQKEFAFPLGRDVVLKVRREVDAHGLHMGWDLSAVDRRLRESPNFFYECRCGHGPRPHDYYAWHFIDMYFPLERILPVYGYPLEVRVRCEDCRVEGREATTAHFVEGTVDIAWRRLPQPNPRQQTIGDILKHQSRKQN